jgi:hypothetical protein
MRYRLLILGLVGLLAAAAPATARTYLASISGVWLQPDESIPSFTVKTWGVEIKAICRIPADWEITGGSFGPLGRIAGEAGHGSSALRRHNLNELRDLALIELSGPIAARSRGSVPPTFGGDVRIDVGRRNTTRSVTLTSNNVELVKADACPPKR